MAGWALAVAAAILAVPVVLLGLAVVLAIIGLLLTLVGLSGAATAVTSGYARWIETLFSPTALPTVIPRLALFAGLVALGALAVGSARRRAARSGSVGGPDRESAVARVQGPISPTTVANRCSARAVEPDSRRRADSAPSRSELATTVPRAARREPRSAGIPRAARYGPRHRRAPRPGVRAASAALPPALLRACLGCGGRAAGGSIARGACDCGPDRRGEPATRGIRSRRRSARPRARRLDGALALPLASDPHLLTFAPEGPWRGETHRVCDRPGSLLRLLEEVARGGRGAGDPRDGVVAPASSAHELSASRGDLRGRAGEQLAAFEVGDAARRARAVHRPLRRPVRHPSGAQSARAARFRRRLRRAVRSHAHAGRAARPRLRGCLPPVHRAGRRRERREDRDSPTTELELADRRLAG